MAHHIESLSFSFLRQRQALLLSLLNLGVTLPLTLISEVAQQLQQNVCQPHPLSCPETLLKTRKGTQMPPS